MTKTLELPGIVGIPRGHRVSVIRTQATVLSVEDLDTGIRYQFGEGEGEMVSAQVTSCEIRGDITTLVLDLRYQPVTSGGAEQALREAEAAFADAHAEAEWWGGAGRPEPSIEERRW